jgi:hypothetical protein
MWFAVVVEWAVDALVDQGRAGVRFEVIELEFCLRIILDSVRCKHVAPTSLKELNSPFALQTKVQCHTSKTPQRGPTVLT